MSREPDDTAEEKPPPRSVVDLIVAMRAVYAKAPSLPEDGRLDAETVKTAIAAYMEGLEYSLDAEVKAALRDRAQLKQLGELVLAMDTIPTVNVLAADVAEDAADRLIDADLSPEDTEMAQLAVEACFFRWAFMVGAPPDEAAWEDPAALAVGWPSLGLVDALYGDMDKFWEAIRAGESRIAAAREEMLETVRRAKEESGEARKVLAERERDEQRRGELERRVQAASAKADSERDGRRRAESERDGARRDARAAEERARAAEAAAATVGADAAGGEEPAAAAEHASALAAARAEAEELRAALERAHRDVDDAQRELEEERRQRRAGTYENAEAEAVAPDAASAAGEDDVWLGLREQLDALPPPADVGDAVRIAAATCEHLVFAERAFETAADSPYRDPGRILHDLVKLDRLAERYAQGSMGRPVVDVARDLGLNWAEGADAAFHGRYGRHYRLLHDGREWVLGPHLKTSAGAGAGGTARTYLVMHPGDDSHVRQVIVGAVGRKLPDRTV